MNVAFVLLASVFLFHSIYCCVEPCLSSTAGFVPFCGNDRNDYIFPIDQERCFYSCNVTALWANTCTCPNFCSSSQDRTQGTCTANGCECKPGYTGYDCSIMSCPSNTCSGRGTCVSDKTFGDYCQCNAGFVSGPNECLAVEESFESLPYGQLFPGEQYTDRDIYKDNHPIFNLSRVASIHVEMNEQDLLQLLYPPTTHMVDYKPVTITFDNGIIRERIENVGMKIKGKASAFKMKKSWKFSFSKFGNKGRRFYGIKTFSTKAGMNEDPTFMRYLLPAEMYRAFNLPAQRSTYTTLYINNHYYGFNWLEEEMDDVFLESRFQKHKGNCYKATWVAFMEYLGDNPETYKNLTHYIRNYPALVYDLMQWDETTKPFEDFVQLVKALNNTAGSELFETAIESMIDLDSSAKGLAIALATGNSDSLFSGNNYLLYFDPSINKFTIMYQGFEQPWMHIQDSVADLYHTGIDRFCQWPKLLSIPKFKTLVKEYVQLLLKKILLNPKLMDRIDRIHRMIEPFVQRDRMYTIGEMRSGEQFNDAVDTLKSMITIRNLYLMQQV